MNQLRLQPLCPATHRDDQPRRAADGLVLCWSCRNRLERHLAELPALHAACEKALQARGGARGTGPVSGTTDPGLSLSEHAVAARTAIHVELHSWCRIVLDEGPWQTPPTATLQAIAAWLTARVDWLASRPWSAEMARTISDTWHEARAAAYPNPVHRVPIGSCPEPGCDGELTAIVRRADDLLPSEVRCDAADRHTWSADQWHALGRALRLPVNHIAATRLVAAMVDTRVGA